MKEHFGKQLKDAREARGYTQAVLGKIVGVSANTIARVERGEQALRWPAMEKAFEAVGQPPSYFFSKLSAAPPKPTLAEALEVVREQLGVDLKAAPRAEAAHVWRAAEPTGIPKLPADIAEALSQFDEDGFAVIRPSILGVLDGMGKTSSSANTRKLKKRRSE